MTLQEQLGLGMDFLEGMPWIHYLLISLPPLSTLVILSDLDSLGS